MKKSYFKKITAALCVLVVAIGVAGCGKNEVTSGANADDVPTLVWYVPGSAQDDIQSVMDEVNKITTKEIGAKLDLQFIEQSAFTERIQMMMSSRKNFDLMLTGYVNTFKSAVDKGGFYDITELVNQNPKLKDSLPDYAWKCATVKGATYAVPNKQIWASSQALALRKDLVDKYNFDVSSIKSVEDAEKFFELVKKNDPDIIPLQFNTSLDLWSLNDVEYYNPSVVLNKKTGELIDYATSDIRINGFYKIRDWYQKGYIRKDIATAQNETAEIKAGRFGAYIVIAKPGAEEELEKTDGFRSVVVPISNPYIATGSIQATMTAVSATTKYPEKCVKFLELINTNKELYNLIVYGIEGKHYTVNEDTTIHVNEDAGYAPRCGWKFGNQFNALVEEGNDLSVWEETEKLNNSATVSPAVGITYFDDNVANEFAQVSTVMSKYPFGKGYMELNDDIIKKYKEDVEKAGCHTIYEEYKKQFDEFMANNQ